MSNFTKLSILLQTECPYCCDKANLAELKMGVSAISRIWVLGQLTLSAVGQLSNTEGPIEPPSIDEIEVQVISKNANQPNQEFMVLVDTWWKILAWSLAVLALSCLCCYFSRCCYLCWDCCSDPFWGCCPRSEKCSRFLLMKGSIMIRIISSEWK